ncbi:MAG: GTP 3',8-cyclase MoaA [Henriciella sp.]|nr:GTP 3',8-cyclase MoaA [Henriciella sp.]
MPDDLTTVASAPLVDQFGRRVTYLRLSVTDRCDLRCTYCMAEKMQFLPKRDLLTIEELDTVARAFIERGVEKIRITGGEPLVRKGMPELFERLGSHLGRGLNELTLTTNATLLEQNAEMLVQNGVKRINVSLDSLDPETFTRVTRRGKLDQVLAGIDAALDAGLKIKINTVALKHENVSELPRMIEWAHGKGMDLTLIEVMPLGETGEDRIDQYIPLPMVRDQLEQDWTLHDVDAGLSNAGPSRYVQVEETGGKLGFITPLTNNFCAGCNRVRVTCTGRIYMCLGQDDHIDLRSALRDSEDPHQTLDACLNRALLKKPERHEFAIDRRGEDPSLPRHMSVTGG